MILYLPACSPVTMPTEIFRLVIFLLTRNYNLSLPLEVFPNMKALNSNIIKISNIFSLVCVNNFNLVIISLHFENFQCPDEPRDIPKGLILAAVEDCPSLLSGTEIKNVWIYTYVPTCLYVIMLYYGQEQFHLYFTSLISTIIFISPRYFLDIFHF
jgi:hypothetical protein